MYGGFTEENFLLASGESSRDATAGPSTVDWQSAWKRRPDATWRRWRQPEQLFCRKQAGIYEMLSLFIEGETDTA